MMSNIEPVAGKIIRAKNGLTLKILSVGERKTNKGMMPTVFLEDEVGRVTSMDLEFFRGHYSWNFEEVR